MNEESHGKRVWFFPDGDIPQPGDGPQKGHESLVILNPNADDAEIRLTVYYVDREPEQPPKSSRLVACAASEWTSQLTATGFPSGSMP